jgi:hypothetical protein
LIDQGEAVLKLNGQDFARVVPVGPETERAAPEQGEWTDAQNSRRCDLIDKEIEGTITRAEAQELHALQQAMLRYRRRVAPLPWEDARQLHQELLRKAQRGNHATWTLTTRTLRGERR